MKLNDKLWLVAALIFFVSAIALWIYVSYFLPFSENYFGEKWVLTEIFLFKIPLPWETKIIQVKPITLGDIFIVLSAICFFEFIRNRLSKTSVDFRKILIVLTAIFIFIFLYEEIWALSDYIGKIASLKNAENATDAETDAIHSEKLNLTFYIKLLYAFLFIAFYFLTYLLRL